MPLIAVGKVLIAAGGTPIPLTSGGYSGAPLAGLGGVDEGLRCQTIHLQALPGNAGIVYYGDSGMVVSTGVRVMGALPKPASATAGPFAEATITVPMAHNALDLAKLFIDGTTNDGVFVWVVQQ